MVNRRAATLARMLGGPCNLSAGTFAAIDPGQQGSNQTMASSKPRQFGRRSVLAGAGAVAGSGAITGFPTIRAQNIKNVTLRQFGTGVSNLNAVADKVKQDLGFTLAMTALDTDAVTWVGAYLNRQGYYTAVLETAKDNMTPDEWGYWIEGKPAQKDILSPEGKVMEKAGAVRDGGSFDERMGRVACWNSVMNEDRYLIQKWNEFIAA